MARVNAILSRSNRDALEDNLLFSGLEINLAGREVYVDGDKISLTPKEYDLLVYLATNKNKAIKRETLLSEIWGYDFYGDDRTIDTHIKMLRNNLRKYREYIETIRGVGYKFNEKAMIKDED
jgi:Response regulators consisting of a CheY-like receiver domain and a winged-helix DNA-binding domain